MAIYAEGKDHAMAIGYTTMSTAQVRHGVAACCFLLQLAASGFLCSG